jgi:hypothetical protein
VVAGPEFNTGYGGMVLKQIDGVPVCFYSRFEVSALDPLGQSWYSLVEIHQGYFPRLTENNGNPSVTFVNRIDDRYVVDLLVHNPSGDGWFGPIRLLEPENPVYLIDSAFSHNRQVVAACAGTDIMYRQSTDAMGFEYQDQQHLGVPGYDCELLELPSGTGVVYTEATSNPPTTHQLWFDRLDLQP